jgi:4-phytase/acid phosphatase
MLVVLLIRVGAGPVPAQEGRASPSVELKFVIILSRHGVRSPTWSTEQLNQYSTAPWPQWHVPPGNLTPHGKTLMQLFGAYDRIYLAQAGLLSPTGCMDAGHVYFRADPEERTLETGRALAAGMLPGCAVEVHSLPEGTGDPLFSPIEHGIGHPDRALAVAAVLGRIGGNPGALLDLYRPELETMQQVLMGCRARTRCPPEGKTVKQSIFELPTSVGPGQGDHLAEMRGPLRTASTLAEAFLLEYTNGMAEEEVGWGRVNETNLREMMSLQCGILRSAAPNAIHRTRPSFEPVESHPQDDGASYRGQGGPGSARQT